MPAQRQPFAELAVMDEQHLAFMNDENRDREINGVMNVRHGGNQMLTPPRVQHVQCLQVLARPSIAEVLRHCSFSSTWWLRLGRLQ